MGLKQYTQCYYLCGSELRQGKSIWFFVQGERVDSRSIDMRRADFQRPHLDGSAWVIDVKLPNLSGVPPLLAAAHNGCLDLVRWLLQKGATTECSSTPDLFTPLHLAAAAGHLAVVRCLIQAGADKDSVSKNGATPLVAAICAERLETVKFLVEAGAGVDPKNAQGVPRSPLTFAVQARRLEVVKFLLAADPDLKALCRGDDSPTCMAAQCGFLEILKSLATAGVDIEATTEDGSSPLLYAVDGGHTEVVQWLLDRRVDVNRGQFREGGGVLSCAANKGRFGLVRSLLAAGADVNRPTNDGRTPLILASIKGCSKSVEHLLEAGAAVDRATEQGITALFAAVVSNYVDVVRLLLASGADTGRVDTCLGLTALAAAAGKGRLEVRHFQHVRSLFLNTVAGIQEYCM